MTTLEITNGCENVAKLEIVWRYPNPVRALSFRSCSRWSGSLILTQSLDSQLNGGDCHRPRLTPSLLFR